MEEIKENLLNCPCCGSDNIHNYIEPIEGENTRIDCHDCQNSWFEPYEFAE